MGARETGPGADRPVIDAAFVDHLASEHFVDDGHPITMDDEDGDERSLEDEDLVRTAFASALVEAIGDKGLIDTPSRSRQDRAQLVEVMQIDLHGREIEELHFIAMSFGFAVSIELDPMMPADHGAE